MGHDGPTWYFMVLDQPSDTEEQVKAFTSESIISINTCFFDANSASAFSSRNLQRLNMYLRETILTAALVLKWSYVPHEKLLRKFTFVFILW